MGYLLVNAQEYLGQNYPNFLPPLPTTDILEKIWIQPPQIIQTGEERKYISQILFDEALEFNLPGVDFISLVFAAENANTVFPFEIIIEPSIQFRLLKIPLALRISSDVFEPMKRIPGTNPPQYERNHSRDYVEIKLADISLTLSTSGNFDFDFEDDIALDEPVRIAGTDVIIDQANFFFDFSGDQKCIAFKWEEANVNAWLGRISPALKDTDSPTSAVLAMRLLFGNGLEEIRVDWAVQGIGRVFRLPGVMVRTPDNAQFSLILGGNNTGIDKLSFILSADANSIIEARSTFAWSRDGGQQRELLNDGERKNDNPNDFEEAMFRLGLSAEERVSLLLLQLDLDSPALPVFFQQLETALTPISPDTDLSSLCTSSTLATRSLDGTIWNGYFQLNVGNGTGNEFKLPFLQSDGAGDGFGQFIGMSLADPQDLGDNSRFGQLLQLPNSNVELPTFELDFDPVTVKIGVLVTVKFGDIVLETDINVIFGLSTFSLEIEHGKGIDFKSDKPKLGSQTEHMGLLWSFEGAKTDDGRYHYFTLATDKYAYGLQQAKNTKFIVSFTKLSEEPIQFILSDFLLSPKGVSITAEVSDEPVRMNGISTRFRFHGTKLIIVDNRITDFTLSGSGPLPPDLVGDAMVDIHLQMAQRDGNLQLIEGGAFLQGNNLLHCEGTRFQFSVDGLGLKFVNENGYHLFFLITGQAVFVLSDSDDVEGPLAWLPTIKIELVKAPLTGDISVLKNHIKFLVELPKPKSFNFLGCFEMEIRGIGFVPSAKEFDGDAAMELTGQLRFAQGLGDTPDSRTDYHHLLIGLPEPGSIIPRIHFKRIALNINFASAFKLEGFVEFVEETNIKGFKGEGMMELQGLPSIAASFAFMRVRRNPDSTWVRAWFVYLEARRFSVMIPVIQIYFREIGFGFGYRYTIASIKEADETADFAELLKKLRDLSRTQGNLSKVDSWALDFEDEGQPVRWTVVLRALVAQTSASSGLEYNEFVEMNLACMFIIDAMIAFRSDLTFFMAARAWINTNYYEFDAGGDNVKNRPLFSGFVLLKPKDQTFLMHVSSNKDGYIGQHPKLPELVEMAIKASLFSATLLVRPGLVHYELGWPNMLGWDLDLDILRMSNRGGFIFRLSDEDFVIGISYETRAELHISAGIDLYFVGVSVEAHVIMGWGARLIAIIKHGVEGHPFYIYGAIGVEMRLYLRISFWIKIPLGFTDIKKTFRFSVGIGYTAALEAGISSGSFGVRGQGTLSLSAMGHSLQINASFKINDGVVQQALQETKHVLDLGLEATEVEPLPGLVQVGDLEAEYADSGAGGGGGGAPGGGFDAMSFPMSPLSMGGSNMIAYEITEIDNDMGGGGNLADAEPDVFEIPGYSVYVIREPLEDQFSYFLLYPRGENAAHEAERGFLPTPPLDVNMPLEYFSDALDKRQLHPYLKTLLMAESTSFMLTNNEVYTPTLGNPSSYAIYSEGSTWILEEHIGTDIYKTRITRTNNIDNLLPQLTIRLDSASVQHTTILNNIPFPVSGSQVNYNQLRHDIEQRLTSAISQALNSNQITELSITNIGNAAIIVGHFKNGNQNFQFQALDRLNEPPAIVLAMHQVFNIPLPTLSLTFEFTGFTFGAVGATNELIVHDDIQSQQLKENQVPTSLEAYFPENVPVTVIQADNGVDPFPWGIELQQAEGTVLVLLGKKKGVNDTRFTSLNARIEPENDFRLVVPALVSTLEQYDPLLEGENKWKTREAELDFSWKVKWDAVVETGTLYKNNPVDMSDAEKVAAENKRLQEITPDTYDFKLAEYLLHAYKAKPKAQIAEDPNVIPVGDPSPVAFAEKVLEDDRIHNPSDDAFEAAVRGAFEQFEGSPYFRRDPNNSYDRALGIAFDPETSIYGNNGNGAQINHSAIRQQQSREQALQMRGVVIQDLIADLQQYYDEEALPESEKPKEPFNPEESIAFQMGLIFRYKGEPSAWLNQLLETSEEPKITQRVGPYDPSPSMDADALRAVRTFNTWATDFSQNPPLFQRVRHYTSSNTIAITWDLFWNDLPEDTCSPCQSDPEHHLMHYRVHRRVLDGTERDVFYTVKDAQALQSDPDEPIVHRLRPRFRIVDHFNDQSEQALADLPEAGRSYQYTVTPVDFSGNTGRPLTLIATRFPDAPPLVPVDAELAVMYGMTPALLTIPTGDIPNRVPIVQPDKIRLRWSDPGERTQGISVPVKSLRLIFRKQRTLPIGSYGLDSETQRPVQDSLPTSNARPLPTDIKIEFSRSEVEFVESRYEISLTGDELQILRDEGVLPDHEWQPEAWRVFIQTTSVNGVRSALAPVALALIANTGDSEGIEERRPAELEFIAQPLNLELLPPEDQRAIPGIAHFPMPGQGDSTNEQEAIGQAGKSGNFRLMSNFANIAFRQHPANLRAVRFRWNQGPSEDDAYPLDLNAGYYLMELDVDANTTDTFDDADELAKSMRMLQEIQMLPADSLLLEPANTLATSQWEAWYPSTIKRLRTLKEMETIRSDTRIAPYYSWRESVLEFPPETLIAGQLPALFTKPNNVLKRHETIHPYLNTVVELLRRTFTVTIQTLPARQAQDLNTFIQATGAGVDPYGWKVLQNLGLSVALSVRDKQSNQLLTGSDLLKNIYLALGLGMLDYALNGYVRPVALQNQLAAGDIDNFDSAVKVAQQKLVAALVQKPDSDLAAELVNSLTALTFTGDQINATKTRLNQVIEAVSNLLDHLYVDVLFQPGRSISLDAQGTKPEDALAMVQISLRPRFRQYRKYKKLTIKGIANETIVLRVELGKDSAGNDVPVSFINMASLSSGQVELEPDKDNPQNTKPILREIKFPLNGEIQLYFSSAVAPKVSINLSLSSNMSLPPSIHECAMPHDAIVGAEAARLEIKPSFNGATNATKSDVINALPEADKTFTELIRKIDVSELGAMSATDTAATLFVVPPTLKSSFADSNNPDGGMQWHRLRNYLELLNGSTDSNDPRIEVPMNGADGGDIQKFLPDFIAWSQRFFDYSGDVRMVDGFARSDSGAWLVTAYPRAGSPAYATPDDAGRLKYDHIYEDRWAHTYRYYIQPYGRYDKLWYSFRHSSALNPTPPTIESDVRAVGLDPKRGGLDIVIDRTEAIEAPLILSSQRLDAPAEPGVPVPPGKIWEVIIAQHPEQALSEHNQTLARSLAFRQVAFTLLRRYAFEDWVTSFNDVIEAQRPKTIELPPQKVTVRAVEQATPPAIPTSYPEAPDHIDLLGDDYTGEDVRSLNVMSRTGRFQQAALVLQWDSLPFYYMHRLLTFAQSSNTVSRVNEVTQRDFEYITPQINEVDGEPVDEAFTEGVTIRNLSNDDVSLGNNFTIINGTLPRLQRVDTVLKRFWDSLPDDAKARWFDEKPDALDSNEEQRKFSSLPDPDVVYQFIQTYIGNLEVQAEVFCGALTEIQGVEEVVINRYQIRQLGREMIVVQSLNILEPEQTHGDFRVQLLLMRLTPIQLLTVNQINSVPLAKIDTQFFLIGALTAAQYQSLVNAVNGSGGSAKDKAIDLATLKLLYDSWTQLEPIGEEFEALPDSVPDTIELISDEVIHLVWDGALADESPISQAEKDALLAMEGDEAQKAAIASLIAAIEKDPQRDGFVYRETMPLPLVELDFSIASTQSYIIALEEIAAPEYRLSLSGILIGDDYNTARATLNAWASLPELRRAADELFEKIDNFAFEEPFVRLRLADDEIPDALQTKLITDGDMYRWVSDLNDADLEALEHHANNPDFEDTDYAVTMQNLYLALSQRHSWQQDFSIEEAEDLAAQIPDALKAKLILLSIDDLNHVLRWDGARFPNDDEQALLGELADGEGAIAEAVKALIGKLNDMPTILMPLGVLEYTGNQPFEGLSTSFDSVVSRLKINKNANTLSWNGKAPTDSEFQLLESLPNTSLAARLRTAIQHLLVVLHATNEIAFPNLPESRLAQVTVLDSTVQWQGRLFTQAEFDLLGDMASMGDIAYKTAIETIIIKLKQAVFSVDLMLNLRGVVPEALQDRFMMTRLLLRYTGMMSHSEGMSLISIYEAAINRNAVQRLYARTVNPIIDGRTLKIRARRGSALPSDLSDFNARPLATLRQ